MIYLIILLSLSILETKESTDAIKDGPSDFETKISQKKKTKKSSLYSQSLLIFIHETPVVESHPTTREIRELLRPRLTRTGVTVFFFFT